MKTKTEIPWATIEEQQQYWIDKEAADRTVDNETGEAPKALLPLLGILKRARNSNDNGSSFQCGQYIDDAITEVCNFKETQQP